MKIICSYLKSSMPKAQGYNQKLIKSQPMPAFRGKIIDGEEYSDYEVELAQRYRYRQDFNWVEPLKKQISKMKFDGYWDANGLYHVFDGIDGDTGFGRSILAICTLGLSEVVNAPFAATETAFRRAKANKIAEETVERVLELISKLKIRRY